MPRVSREKAEQNRATIELASSRLIREHGLRVSVADLMGAAGLTHGGFYGHFRSKDELTAIACATAFAESEERWKKRIAGASNAKAARTELVKAYLSDHNRASPGSSCPLAALVVDVAREDANKPVRQAFKVGLERLLNLLSDVQSSSEDSNRRRQNALVQISSMVGALVLARATQGDPISDEFLETVRARLLRE